MPQIPTFQQTLGVPRTTGVPNLSLQAPVDKSAEVLVDIGNTFGKIGERLQLAQDKREVSSSTLAATLKLNDLKTELSKVDGQQAISLYDTKSQIIYQDLTSGMSTRALDAFNVSWNKLSASSTIAIKSAGVKRWKQRQKGDLLFNLRGFVASASGNDTSKLGRETAIAEGIKDINEMEKTRIIDPLEAAKLRLKHTKDVAQAGINSMIRTAPLGQLDELFNQMAADSITNPDLKKYWDSLDGGEKQALQNKVSVMHERKLNIAEKREKQGLTDNKRKYDKNYAFRMKQIILARQGVNDQIQPPTLIELTNDLAAGRIDSKRFDQLSAALKNADPVGSDNTYIKDVLGQIRGAKTGDELNGIIKDMEKQLGPKGKLKFNDFQILERRALAAIGNSPETKRANSYSKALTKVLASTDFLDKVLPGAKDRAAFVQIDFEARIADGEDPAVAFTEALEAFRTRGTVKLNSIPRPQFGPAKRLNEWTLEEVEEARTETITKFRGKANTLATQMLILNSISSYLGAHKKAVEEASEKDANHEKSETKAEKLRKLRSGND